MKTFIGLDNVYVAGILAALATFACGGQIDEPSDPQELSYRAASTSVRTKDGTWVSCAGSISMYPSGVLNSCIVAVDTNLKTTGGALVNCKAGTSVHMEFFSGKLIDGTLARNAAVTIFGSGSLITCQANAWFQLDSAGNLRTCTLLSNTNVDGTICQGGQPIWLNGWGHLSGCTPA